ncbi:MAG: hypothetical protein LBF22_06895 [Deltaproteobacteria bacterium]|nr:hypothetical protein [Deltaproteobacteria bacterium]
MKINLEKNSGKKFWEKILGKKFWEKNSGKIFQRRKNAAQMLPIFGKKNGMRKKCLTSFPHTTR